MAANRISVTINPKNNVLVNQSGIIAVRRLNDLLDVDTSAKTDGAILIYDEAQNKFIASTILEKQIIDGGIY